MKKIIFKVITISIVLLTNIVSQAQNTEFSWTNTTSCGYTVSIFDATTALIYSSATPGGPICINGFAAYAEVFDGSCTKTIYFNSTVSFPAAGCNCLSATHVFSNTFGPAGTMCGLGAVFLNLSIY